MREDITNVMPEWRGRNFPDDIFKRIFLNENICVLIQMSLKFVPKGLIDDKSAYVLEIAWRRTVDKPCLKPLLT